MIEVQGMYKYGGNGRKFVSFVLKSYEYICYVRNVARKVIGHNRWNFCYVGVHLNSN
jgi:hypothetical protein